MQTTCGCGVGGIGETKICKYTNGITSHYHSRAWRLFTSFLHIDLYPYLSLRVIHVRLAQLLHDPIADG